MERMNPSKLWEDRTCCPRQNLRGQVLWHRVVVCAVDQGLLNSNSSRQLMLWLVEIWLVVSVVESLEVVQPVVFVAMELCLAVVSVAPQTVGVIVVEKLELLAWLVAQHSLTSSTWHFEQGFD